MIGIADVIEKNMKNEKKRLYISGKLNFCAYFELIISVKCHKLQCACGKMYIPKFNILDIVLVLWDHKFCSLYDVYINQIT